MQDDAPESVFVGKHQQKVGLFFVLPKSSFSLLSHLSRSVFVFFSLSVCLSSLILPFVSFSSLFLPLSLCLSVTVSLSLLSSIPVASLSHILCLSVSLSLSHCLSLSGAHMFQDPVCAIVFFHTGNPLTRWWTCPSAGPARGQRNKGSARTCERGNCRLRLGCQGDGLVAKLFVSWAQQ